MPWGLERLPQSLSARLLGAYLAAWLLAAGVAGIAVAWFLRGDPLHWADHSALFVADILKDGVSYDAHGLPRAPALSPEVAWLVQASPLDLGYRVFDDQGRVVRWSSTQVQQAWDAAGHRPIAQAGHGHAERGGLMLRLRTLPLGDPAHRYWLEVGLSERLITLLHAGNAAKVGGMVITLVALSVLLLGAVQWVVLRRVMRPVRQISAQARRIELNRPGQQLAGDHLPLELRPLVASFNDCLQRLEQAHQRHVHFLADAAHELKTPLSLLRAQLELGDAEPAVLLRDVDHLSRQVQQWLVLAEVAEGQGYRSELLDAGQVASEVCIRLAPLAMRHDVTLQLTVESSPLRLHGDRSALFVLLKNLVENAIGFAPAGSAVAVHLTDASLHVRDLGPGIAAEHLPRLFERFWRAPSRRDVGAGLGLAICREVAEAHGWHLSAHDARPGAEFVLHFRPAPTPSAPTAPDRAIPPTTHLPAPTP